jgi:hypothetical protein
MQHPPQQCVDGGGALTNHPTSVAMNGQNALIYNDLTVATTNGTAANDGLKHADGGGNAGVGETLRKEPGLTRRAEW